MRGLFFGVALITFVGCVESELTPLGPARPAQFEPCDITLLTARQPDYPFVDLALVRASCPAPFGRKQCMEEIRRRACAVGGETVYGVKETDDGCSMTGTIAARDLSAMCTPLCSPGFACQGTVCVPQCNPACETGEVCNRHRSCEPAVHASNGSEPAERAAH
jgi:hypothetical protein